MTTTTATESTFTKVSVKVFYIVLSVFLVINTIQLFCYSTDDFKNSGSHGKAQFSDYYRAVALPIPEKLDFCGEPVPTENWDVREMLDRELMINVYWQSQTLLHFKRAARYFPIIEPILKKNGVPDDFKYLAIVESSLSNAGSPTGAKGFWQIMEETGKELGLEIREVHPELRPKKGATKTAVNVDYNVDERFHLEKATEAACKYLLASYKRYHSWTLVAASYNSGRGAVERFMDKQQEGNFYELWLAEETMRYVYRIAAVKVVMQNAKQYGFDYKPEDLYPVIPTHLVQVDTTIRDLAQFARFNGTTYKMLKYFNPWLRQANLDNKAKKTYFIKIPQAGSRKYYHKDFDINKSSWNKIPTNADDANELEARDLKESK